MNVIDFEWPSDIIVNYWFEWSSMCDYMNVIELSDLVTYWWPTDLSDRLCDYVNVIEMSNLET